MMPSYEAVRPSPAPGYLLQSSHAEGFFSEEERARRKKVLDRLLVPSSRNETGISKAHVSDNFASENDRNKRLVDLIYYITRRNSLMCSYLRYDMPAG